MASLTSLNVAVSGMRAAQVGLAVTAHNMANAEINGFSRQRAIQMETFSRGIGTSFSGTPLRVGMGTDTGPIHQIRSPYFDMLYRNHNAKLNFYATKASIGEHMENVLGETEGSYRFQAVLSDMWNAMNEINISVGGIETREFFIGTSIAFIEAAQNVFDELFALQQNLDNKIRHMVTEINDLVAGINDMNAAIELEEYSGDKANDLRDERNRMLDTLSGFMPIKVNEHSDGRVDILTINGHFLLSQGSQNRMGLLEISGRYSFVEPVFTLSQTPLPPDTPPDQYVPFYTWTRPINSEVGNDHGALMSLLQARGAMPATYNGIESLWKPIELPSGTFADLASIIEEMIGPEPDIADFETNAEFLYAQLVYQNELDNIEKLYPEMVRDPAAFIAAVNAGVNNPDFDQMHGIFRAMERTYRQAEWSMQNALIPNTMMNIDRIVNSVVRMVNDLVAPVDNHMPCGDAPFDLNGNRSHTEVFVRRLESRFNEDDIHHSGLPGNMESFYTTRNLMINPIFATIDTNGNAGHNLLALSTTGDIDDTRVIQEMLRLWREDTGPYSIEIEGSNFSIERAYQIFITNLAIELNESNTVLSSQYQQVVQADDRRNRIMGVAMDEELTSMMTYQFAYQAAARLFNIVDGMLDVIVNQLKR